MRHKTPIAIAIASVALFSTNASAGMYNTYCQHYGNAAQASMNIYLRGAKGDNLKNAVYDEFHKELDKQGQTGKQEIAISEDAGRMVTMLRKTPPSILKVNAMMGFGGTIYRKCMKGYGATSKSQ